jgi:hypothetical protein
VVHLRGMHAHTHRVLTNLDFYEVQLLHLMCNLNGGKVNVDLDSRMMGILTMDANVHFLALVALMLKSGWQ